MKTLLGGCVLWGLVPVLPAEHPVVIGAFGFAGLILVLHFGLFHLLSLAWRWHGVDVRPIMRCPFLARSLAEFWGERWNRAYRQVSFTYFFRPAASRFGAAAGTLIAFFTSGLIHELVISFPARAGFGGPTAYFLVQGLGLLFERMAVCRRLNLRYPLCGWCYTLVLLLGPIGWLFHGPFLTDVIVPFLGAVGAR
jgi:alginate O-acetyltransferase complex protein AlgI